MIPARPASPPMTGQGSGPPPIWGEGEGLGGGVVGEGEGGAWVGDGLGDHVAVGDIEGDGDGGSSPMRRPEVSSPSVYFFFDFGRTRTSGPSRASSLSQPWA